MAPRPKGLGAQNEQQTNKNLGSKYLEKQANLLF